MPDYQTFYRRTRVPGYIPGVTPLAAITMGPGATDRSTGGGANSTRFDLANPAARAGTITSWQVWFSADATNVKAAVFYGTAPNFTCRSVQAIGDVASGSLKTFSVSLAVQAGDYIGVYYETGNSEVDGSGGSGFYYKSGDHTADGSQEYTLSAAAILSVYGTGN